MARESRSDSAVPGPGVRGFPPLRRVVIARRFLAGLVCVGRSRRDHFGNQFRAMRCARVVVESLRRARGHGGTIRGAVRLHSAFRVVRSSREETERTPIPSAVRSRETFLRANNETAADRPDRVPSVRTDNSCIYTRGSLLFDRTTIARRN